MALRPANSRRHISHCCLEPNVLGGAPRLAGGPSGGRCGSRRGLARLTRHLLVPAAAPSATTATSAAGASASGASGASDASSLPLVDLRSPAAFAAAHLAGAASIPAPELQARSLELPPPYGPTRGLALMAEAQDLPAAREYLESKGWEVRAVLPPEGLLGRDSPADAAARAARGVALAEPGAAPARLWRPTAFLETLLRDPVLRAALLDEREGGGSEELEEAGTSCSCGARATFGRRGPWRERRTPPSGDVASGPSSGPAVRCARCTHVGEDECLSRWGDPAAAGAAARGGPTGPDGPPRRRLALDVGSGNGRDALYLRDMLGPSWAVLGVDNHVGALARARALVGRCGRDGDVRFAARDVRKRGAVPARLRADLVLGARFLDRALLTRLRDSVVRPGGALVWVHFLEGCAAIAPPRRPSRYLFEGELQETFAGWEVIRYEQGELMNAQQQTLPAAFFAARKPLAPTGG